MTYSEYMASIKNTGEDIWNDEEASSYAPFLIQRGLYSDDATALQLLNLANQKIKDKKLHYHFLLHSMPKTVRYVAKGKKKKDALTVRYLSAVRKYYGYNEQKAKEALTILSLKQLQQIESWFDKGGIEGQ